MRNSGFALIELVIILAVIGILVTIALSAYDNSIERTRRADCTRHLREIASRQVQFYTYYSSYTDIIRAPANCKVSSCGLDLSTADSEHDTCVVSASVLPNHCGPATNPFIPCDSFTLTATLNNDKRCATLGLDSRGQKRATPASDSSLTGDALVDFCWR